jgi:hypothetical protein
MRNDDIGDKSGVTPIQENGPTPFMMVWSYPTKVS